MSREKTMNKEYRITRFEQIINNIQTAIDMADEIEVKDVKDRLESLLSDLENIYDKFASNVDGEVKA